MLASLAHDATPIVLFDEIENHLHPAYMSLLLSALKERSVQTIVSTHHPHLIFSDHADRVFFLDTTLPHSPGRKTEEYSRRSSSKRNPGSDVGAERAAVIYTVERGVGFTGRSH